LFESRIRTKYFLRHAPPMCANDRLPSPRSLYSQLYNTLHRHCLLARVYDSSTQLSPSTHTHTHPFNTTTALCQPFTTTTFAKHAFRCSTPAVWNSLPQTVLSSDSVAVFKLRLKTFLFSQAFSSFSAH